MKKEETEEKEKERMNEQQKTAATEGATSPLAEMSLRTMGGWHSYATH